MLVIIIEMIYPHCLKTKIHIQERVGLFFKHPHFYNLQILVTGWSGTFCDQQQNECESNPCYFGGTCVDLVGGFRCLCVEGVFMGERCEAVIRQCGFLNPCGDHAICVNLPAGEQESLLSTIFSCDQTALRTLLSVCPSVRLWYIFHNVPLIASSWNFQDLLPLTKVMSMQKSKSEAKGQGHRGQNPI